MASLFDTALKHLVEAKPEAWLAYAGLPVHTARVMDADLSTLSAEADKVLRVEADPPYIAHLEAQSFYDRNMDARTLRYNVLIHYLHGLLVRSVVFLLRPQADGPGMTGRVTRGFPGEEPYLDFRYHIVRVWETPMEDALAGALETLPLAPLADVPLNRLPEVIQRMDTRIQVEATPAKARELWVGAYVLMGLRYPEDTIQLLMKGVGQMTESVTYMKILREGEAKGMAEGMAAGRLEEARNMVLRLGALRFGAADRKTKRAIQGVTAPERLEQMLEHLLKAESWAELLG